ncbi:MAG: NUDIX hydrolase [Oligoflexia bacterium]|nr:NUDIX hydrolase [Oligoflexia bacterium]
MRIKLDDKDFVYRVAGVATFENRVLLHRAESDNFWALPGGACEFNEDSRTALKREINEELNAEIEVGELLWVVENFFVYDGVPWHEIGLYYHFRFTGESQKFYRQDEFEGVESFFRKDQDIRLIYKWIPQNKMPEEDIRPKFLREALRQLPKHTEVIVNRDWIAPRTL